MALYCADSRSLWRSRAGGFFTFWPRFLACSLCSSFWARCGSSFANGCFSVLCCCASGRAGARCACGMLLRSRLSEPTSRERLRRTACVSSPLARRGPDRTSAGLGDGGRRLDDRKDSRALSQTQLLPTGDEFLQIGIGLCPRLCPTPRWRGRQRGNEVGSSPTCRVRDPRFLSRRRGFFRGRASVMPARRIGQPLPLLTSTPFASPVPFMTRISGCGGGQDLRT